MKQLTSEQQAKRDERRAKFKALWKQVADMPEADRIKATAHLGLVTCDGHELSLCNSMLVVLQRPSSTVLGGFRQWLKHGRAVRKGEHGAMVWIPTRQRKEQAVDASDSPVNGEAEVTRQGFIIGTLFDIGQTEAIEESSQTADTTSTLTAD